VGRSSSNSIRVTCDKYISRSHFKIVIENNVPFVADLGQSKQGTTLNEVRITKAPLKPGDLIGVGKSQFIFQVKDGLSIFTQQQATSATPNEEPGNYENSDVICSGDEDNDSDDNNNDDSDDKDDEKNNNDNDSDSDDDDNEAHGLMKEKEKEKEKEKKTSPAKKSNKKAAKETVDLDGDDDQHGGMMLMNNNHNNNNEMHGLTKENRKKITATKKSHSDGDGCIVMFFCPISMILTTWR